MLVLTASSCSWATRARRGWLWPTVATLLMQSRMLGGGMGWEEANQVERRALSVETEMESEGPKGPTDTRRPTKRLTASRPRQRGMRPRP